MTTLKISSTIMSNNDFENHFNDILFAKDSIQAFEEKLEDLPISHLYDFCQFIQREIKGRGISYFLQRIDENSPVRFTELPKEKDFFLTSMANERDWMDKKEKELLEIQKSLPEHIRRYTKVMNAEKDSLTQQKSEFDLSIKQKALLLHLLNEEKYLSFNSLNEIKTSREQMLSILTGCNYDNLRKAIDKASHKSKAARQEIFTEKNLLAIKEAIKNLNYDRIKTSIDTHLKNIESLP